MQRAGVIPLELVARESGLSVMQGILEGGCLGRPLPGRLNFWLSKVEEGT
jgi:hypothetical protein